MLHEKPSLLLVEDEKDLRETVIACLNELNLTIYQACNGQEGIEIFLRKQPTAILTDLMMPVLGGLEMIAQLRNIYCESPILIFTGYADYKNTLSALRLGVYDFIEKPFDNENFLIKVNEIIEYGSRLKEFEQHWADFLRQHPEIDSHNKALKESKRELFRMKFFSQKKTG